MKFDLTRGFAALLIGATVGLLGGCSTTHEAQSSEVRMMSRAEARSEVYDLYTALEKLLGGQWQVGADDWLSCTTPSGAAGEAFGFLSQRLEQPLGLAPSVATEKLQELWERQGVKASLSIRRSGVSPEYILSDPPFGAGAYEDGFAIQLTMSESAVTFNGSGRCVPVEDGQP